MHRSFSPYKASHYDRQKREWTSLYIFSLKLSLSLSLLYRRPTYFERLRTAVDRLVRDGIASSITRARARGFWWRTPRRIGSSREKRRGGAHSIRRAPTQEGSQIQSPFISRPLTSGASFLPVSISRIKIENEYWRVNTRPRFWIRSKIYSEIVEGNSHLFLFIFLFLFHNSTNSFINIEFIIPYFRLVIIFRLGSILYRFSSPSFIV